MAARGEAGTRMVTRTRVVELDPIARARSPYERGVARGLLFVALALAACTESTSQFDGPTQAVIGGDGLVYVGDGYYHARVAVFSADGELVREWGSRGFASGQFHNPHGLALTLDGRLVVADRDNARIQVFDRQGALLDVWAPEGLGRPWSVALAPDGALFVADGGDQDPNAPRAGIVELDDDGTVRQRFGDLGSAPGELSEPHMLAVSATRAVYVTELGNRRVQRFEPSPGCAPAQELCTSVVDESWPQLPTDVQLDPLSVATAAGRVYVGHQGDGAPIWIFEEEGGALIARIGEGTVERPHGLAVDADGNVWVADDYGDRVVRLDPDGRVTLALGEEEP